MGLVLDLRYQSKVWAHLCHSIDFPYFYDFLHRRYTVETTTLCLKSHLAVQGESPSLTELREILWTNRKPVGSVDQVWPKLYVGDESVARDKARLSSLGVTHVLNAAAGQCRINTGPRFYTDTEVVYHGVEAPDHPEFDLRPFFSSAARFIDSGLKENGKVLVHCAMGVSRSGALVLAYLMIHQGLTLVEAITAVRLCRDIGPNSGFLEQLRQLDLTFVSSVHRIFPQKS
uniref:Dual specificity protein phosphatase n=1 Tax=Fundulus heteroclitus TaxID=8078 RepID=A0A3Q2QEL5_FUNHE